MKAAAAATAAAAAEFVLSVAAVLSVLQLKRSKPINLDDDRVAQMLSSKFVLDSWCLLYKGEKKRDCLLSVSFSLFAHTDTAAAAAEAKPTLITTRTATETPAAATTTTTATTAIVQQHE